LVLVAVIAAASAQFAYSGLGYAGYPAYSGAYSSQYFGNGYTGGLGYGYGAYPGYAGGLAYYKK
jgi:hypothetical protein